MRTRVSVALGAALLGAAVLGSPQGRALAHHAFGAEFDANRPVLLKGKITKVEWVNPHAWIHVQIDNEQGQQEVWMVEGGTPNTLLRRGINRNSLTPGTEIVVDGYQSKDRSKRANGRNLTFPDGRKLFMGSSGTGAPRDGSDPTEPPRPGQTPPPAPPGAAPSATPPAPPAQPPAEPPKDAPKP
jgi:hypothetical protein